MAEAGTRCVRLLISGRVQGVGYRYWTVGQARRRGLIGWVRNLRDGRVEAIVFGPARKVESLVEACRAGPPAADVSGIEIGEAEPPEGMVRFEQRPTA